MSFSKLLGHFAGRVLVGGNDHMLSFYRIGGGNKVYAVTENEIRNAWYVNSQNFLPNYVFYNDDSDLVTRLELPHGRYAVTFHSLLASHDANKPINWSSLEEKTIILDTRSY